MTEAGDTGATLHAEFNKHASRYQINYTNPITSGEIQDILREEEDSTASASPKKSDK
ncbi:hypothetical protein [Sporomusa sp.]|jgi:hypothetical protein|uniref:hypothetical protein n=1 Tax=Sporomusa sp. TaxID=2078658 RepID=UPI002C488C5F|nr:hypothetical protein [Sporomusa sp.]HWR08365.1 hypothetical protein [Sporomusa sp.]